MEEPKSLDQIMDEGRGAPPSPTAEPSSPSGERPPQPRDEGGRWTRPAIDPKPGDTPTQPSSTPSPPSQPDPAAPAGTPPPAGFVPIQAMDARLAKHEERFAALQAQNEILMRQLMGVARPAQPAAPPPAAPDFFDNPDAAFDHRLRAAVEPLQQQQQSIIEQFSSMMAVDKHGFDTVRDAYQAMAQHVQQNGPNDPTYIRVMKHQHPYGELVRWFREQQALKQYGDDPTAYRERLREEILAEMRSAQPQPAAGSGAPPTAAPQTPMPSNFSGRANAGARTVAGTSGPLPLSQIMGR